MRPRAASRLLVLAATLFPPCAAGAAETLCAAEESIVFSCPSGAHVASLCASRNISKAAGILQYRFGEKGRVDLAYPEPGAKPADAFVSGTMMFLGGGGAWGTARVAPSQAMQNRNLSQQFGIAVTDSQR